MRLRLARPRVMCFAVCWFAGAEGARLLVARGTSARPLFETLQLPSHPPKTPSAALVTLDPPSSGVLLPPGASQPPSASAAAGGGATGGKRGGAGAHISVLGPGAQLATGTIGAPALRTAAVSALQPANGLGPGGGSAQDGCGEADGAEEGDEQQQDEGEEDEGMQPLGERVAALASKAGVGGGGGEAEEEGHAAAVGPSGSDRANSLAVLLTQALRR